MSVIYRITVRAAMLITALFLMPQLALASGWEISPVRVNLSKKKPIGSFVLKNMTNQPVVLQGKVKLWTQKQGEDVYTKSDELIFAPPIVKIAPGKAQIFRVGLRQKHTEVKEASYRLFIHEVVKSLDTGEEGIRFALQVSLPVFVEPKQLIHAPLNWDVIEKSSEVEVRATNPSNRHVQVSHLLVKDKLGKNKILDKNTFHYLLAGQSYSWHFPKKNKKPLNLAKDKQAKLSAKTDFGNIDADIRIS